MEKCLTNYYYYFFEKSALPKIENALVRKIKKI